jgi:hypothetical protein
VSRRVVTAPNLFDYFHTRVEDARSGKPVKISDDTSLYLATLLTERARADRPAPPEQTLAELHMRAANAPPAEQARTYRELGDRALYLLGYFAESLSRRTVGPAYYAEMGQAAYLRTDHVFKKWFSDAFGPVFSELSTHFEGCVSLIEDVRESHEKDHPDDPIWLYERWQKTGSEAYARRLREIGILLMPHDKPEDA